MSIESNLVLYHCNDEKRCSRFVNSDKYMIVSHEDGSWLGQGMYFWDNLGNAKNCKSKGIHGAIIRFDRYRSM